MKNSENYLWLLFLLFLD